MVLYTIVPPWQVMGSAPQGPAQQRPFARGILEGRMGETGFVVERICSTDPRAFLDPTVTVGTVLPAGEQPDPPQNNS